MTDFYHAPSWQQSALMVFVFLGMVFCLYSFFVLYYRQNAKRLHYILAGIIFVVLLALDATVRHGFWAMQQGVPYREILLLPMGVLWCIAVLAFILLAVGYVMLLRVSKQELHRDSIKQAFDILPSAICYFTSEGDVKLCNLQMHRLFHTLGQSDLQNLEELRRALDACDRQRGVSRLFGETQTYLFPDGKVWHYSETKVTTGDGAAYTESIFTDVTALYAHSLQLEEQTKRLEQLSCELKQLSSNVQIAAREQEIVSVKTELHDRMGAGVLAVRRSLQGGRSTEASYALALFQRAVQYIQKDNECLTERRGLVEFLQDADTIGVKVTLSGDMPQEEAVSHAFLLAMNECLTNAVRHADASEMRIEMEQKESTATLRITNNGTVPTHMIVPKGGLKNLESHIANLQGMMEIQSQPRFALYVTIPFSKEVSK